MTFPSLPARPSTATAGQQSRQQDHGTSTLSSAFTTAQARQALLSPRDLVNLVALGDVDELPRGVYRRTDASEIAHPDLLAVYAPRAVVCGKSTHALHELIDDIPAAVQIVVHRGARRPTITYPPTVVAQYTAKTFSRHRTVQSGSRRDDPCLSATHSVVDAMRHRSRIGETLAPSALSRYLRRNGRCGVSDLQHIARELGALSVIRPAVGAVLA